MRFFICLLFVAFTNLISAQIELDKISYNFGFIEKDTKRWVDFKLTNNTNTHIYLMRSNKDEDLDLIYTRGKIEKDSVAYIRVQINPTSIGPFSKKVELYISTEKNPLELSLKGSVNYFDPGNDPVCPDFSNQKPMISNELTAIVEVLDKTTNKPIKNAIINVSNPQLIKFNSVSDRMGKTNFKTINGIHHIFVSANGYNQTEKNELVTYNNNYITLFLDKKIVEEEEVIIKKSIDEEIDQYIKEELVEKESNVVIENQVDEQKNTEKQYVPQFPNELPVTEFAPNNIVFLMDISNSMNKLEKFDLLKVAVKEMISVLRSFDRIAIITYASSVNIVLSSTSGAEKEKLYAIIDSLKAGGLTARSSGIKGAYELAFNNFIDKANNQIVLTTDGAFNVEEKDYNVKQEVMLNSFKGIKLSVVGVKTGRLYIPDLKKLSKWGRGNYIHIKNEKEAKESLVEELKKNSKIK